MFSLYNSQAPKKATNLSINSDLINQSKHFDINLSSVLEQTLVQLLQEKQRQQWLTENQESIAAYNQEVQKNGCFGDDVRLF
ncbi:MAG: type II toxin-antitoxin system CcdA family antitoxin [Agitococcus sp.]|nr:type II toxin-antitoxin system CcdA family antitoxin [Agitococcus sp.]